ncbi:MAG: hypothetical protein RL596_234 [Bacteroidota bacterium]
MPQVFTILTPQEVDTVLWEQCLHNNKKQASLYMHINYLHALTDNWLPIINQDYSIIAAVPYRKKWGIIYAYTAPFIQATTIVGAATAIEKKAILSIIQQKFRYGTLALNNINELSIGEEKTNFILPLNTIYANIERKFSADLKQNIKKAYKYQLQYTHSNDLDDAITLYRIMNDHKTPHVKENNYSKLTNYCTNNSDHFYIRIAQDPNNRTLAIALLLKKYDKLYNILNAVTDNGRKLGANHFLLSNIIKEFSNTNLTFDFEGSSIPGIQQFLQGFNPITEHYTIYHYNMLLRFKP